MKATFTATEPCSIWGFVSSGAIEWTHSHNVATETNFNTHSARAKADITTDWCQVMSHHVSEKIQGLEEHTNKQHHLNKTHRQSRAVRCVARYLIWTASSLAVLKKPFVSLSYLPWYFFHRSKAFSSETLCTVDRNDFNRNCSAQDRMKSAKTQSQVSNSKRWQS